MHDYRRKKMADYREGPTGPTDFTFGFVVGVILTLLAVWIF